MTNVCFVSGSRGGCGKTILSLSLGLSLFPQKIVFVDASANNPDLYQAFNRVGGHQILNSSFVVTPIFDNGNGSFYYCKLFHLAEVISFIPVCLSEINPDVIIIDLGQNLFNPNFSFPDKLNEPSIWKQVKPVFFHIWSIASLLDPDFDLKLSACLDKIKSVWKDFDFRSNFVNVFNIYEIQNIALENSRIRELDFIGHKIAPDGISPKQLQLFRRNYIQIINDDSYTLSDKAREMYEAVGEAINITIKEKEFDGNLPKNILSIPFNFFILTSFIDLRAPKIDSINGLIGGLGGFIKIVKTFTNSTGLFNS